MRVIVAGSVDWPMPDVVYDALWLCAEESGRQGKRLTVMVGHGHKCRNVACTGAAHDAYEWVAWARGRHLPVTEAERYPVEWSKPCRMECVVGHRQEHPDGTSTCPSAGYYRNETMVAAGADLWMTFVDRTQKGTSHLMKVARAAGIDGQEFRL